MRIQSDSGDFVEIERADSGADLFEVLLVVRASRKGFSAQIDAWVSRAAMSAFAQDFAALERTRQGSVRLDGNVPGELSLTIRSIDRAGHFGVEGTLGTTMSNAEVSMNFSAFTFDPSLLPTIAREAAALAEAPSEDAGRSSLAP